MQKQGSKQRVAFAVGCVLMGICTAALVPTHMQARQTVPAGIGPGNPAQIQTGNPPINPADSVNGAAVARQQEMREHQAMDDRHKRMVDDADKLLELVTELKSDVDKSTKYETSAAAIKKAAEIEKLAHDVRDRMRN